MTILSGLLGGTTIALIGALARAIGFTHLNIEMSLGSALVNRISFGAWVLGFLINLVLSVIVAFIYRFCFQHIVHRANWRVGFSIAIVHCIIAGFLFGLVPGMPRTLDVVPPAPTYGLPLMPGIFAYAYGWTAALVFIIVHLAYGTLLGAIASPSEEVFRMSYRPAHSH